MNDYVYSQVLEERSMSELGGEGVEVDREGGAGEECERDSTVGWCNIGLRQIKILQGECLVENDDVGCE